MRSTLVLVLGLFFSFHVAHGQNTTAFSYQGYLEDGGAPADGSYAFRFRLYDASKAGSQVGADVKQTLNVADGIFTTLLDFGSVFDGQALWLQVAVDPAGSGSYTDLNERQRLLPVPYAMGLTLPLTASGNEASALLRVENAGAGASVEGVTSSTGGGATGVRGEVTSTSPGSYSAGVLGINRGASGNGIGVYGSQDGFGWGVYGTTPSGRGVFGQSSSGMGVFGLSSSSYGVHGQSANSSGVFGRSTNNYGVEGLTVGTGSSSRAVYGYASASSGTNYGIYGNTNSPDGWAGYFEDRAYARALHVNTTASTATSLYVVRNRGSIDAEGPEDHVALIQNTSTNPYGDVLALKTSRTGTPGGLHNFITFFDGDDDALGAIEGNAREGITYKTGGADYAELLPRLEPEEALRPGDLVGVFGGHVTRRTAGAPQLLVLSTNAAVLGNARPDTDHSLYEATAFVGQVEARVHGPVSAGDLIVASGEADGTGRAVAPAAYDPFRHGPVAGRAWADAPGEGLQAVRVAVGLEDGAALVGQLQRQQAQLQRQGEALQALQDEVAALRALVMGHAALTTEANQPGH